MSRSPFPPAESIQVPFEASSSLEQARERLLADGQAWMHSCVERYANTPASDVHDQATYCSGWEPLLRAEADEEVLAFLKQTRDRIHRHYVESDQWNHGYWRMHEAHHGTEHFELFLAMLHRVDPEDEQTRDAFLDMAEHLGNWSPEVEAWYDEGSNSYRSTWFGSDGVRLLPGCEINVPDHVRCSNLALIAYDISREERYLDLALRQMRRWAEPMASEGWIPVALIPEQALRELNEEQSEAYRNFAGQSPKHLDQDVCRAENLLASDAPRTLLRLWQHSGEALYRDAAECLLDPLATQLQDVDAGPAAEALRIYRNMTQGSQRYDAQIRAILKPDRPKAFQHLSMDLSPKREMGEEIGVGKRSDRPLWLEDGKPRSFNPISLATVAQLDGDTELATLSLDAARSYLNLARKLFPDGRDHGCSSRSVSAIARGHGRDNHAGMLTAVLGPFMEANVAASEVQ